MMTFTIVLQVVSLAALVATWAEYRRERQQHRQRMRHLTTGAMLVLAAQQQRISAVLQSLGHATLATWVRAGAPDLSPAPAPPAGIVDDGANQSEKQVH